MVLDAVIRISSRWVDLMENLILDQENRNPVALDVAMADILDGESDAWNLIIYQVVSFPMLGPDI